MHMAKERVFLYFGGYRDAMDCVSVPSFSRGLISVAMDFLNVGAGVFKWI